MVVDWVPASTAGREAQRVKMTCGWIKPMAENLVWSMLLFLSWDMEDEFAGKKFLCVKQSHSQNRGVGRSKLAQATSCYWD